MTIAPVELQVLWSSAAFLELNTGNGWVGTSDAMTMNTATGMASIELKANQTDGTPASGDFVDFYVLGTLGDPDGAGADEYATPEHATFLAKLDVNVENPAIVAPLNFPVPMKGFKIYAIGSGFATTDDCDISATVLQATA